MHILISLRPEWWEAMLRDLNPKCVEFRRQLGNHHPKPGEKVFVYRSRTDRGLVGHFDTTVAQGKPSLLWQNYGSRSGMYHGQFNKYFSGSSHGYALTVDRLTIYERVVPFGDVFPGGRPPQNFQYMQPQQVFRAAVLSGSVAIEITKQCHILLHGSDVALTYYPGEVGQPVFYGGQLLFEFPDGKQVNPKEFFHVVGCVKAVQKGGDNAN